MGYRHYRRDWSDRPRRHRISRRDRDAIEHQATVEGLGELLGDLAFKAVAGVFHLLAFPFRALLGRRKAVTGKSKTAPATIAADRRIPVSRDNRRATLSRDYQPPPPPGESYEAGVARIASRMAYCKLDAVLTRGERAFWHPLQQAVGARYLILCKVRLADLAAVQDHRSDAYRKFRDIGMFHVDFVLCHPQTTAPLLVIELDDRSHGTSSSLKRDRFKDAVLRSACLPIYRVRCQQAYAPDEIATEVARLLR